MSAPKAGDRVRCTLGESVIVGRFLGGYDAVIEVHAEGARYPNGLEGPWTVEVLPAPELPVGTVVLDRDGDAWQRTHASAWRCTEPRYDGRPRDIPTFDDLDQAWGPLTLLEVAHA